MNRQKGFGLLEILITLVVLGVGIVGLVSMSKSALKVSQDGRRYETAMRLAESKLDEFRNFNGVMTATAPLTAYNQITSASAAVTLSGEPYSLAWTVTNQYLNGSTWQGAAPAGYRLSYPGRKAVTVNVGWSDSEGQSHTLQLTGNISPIESLSTDQLNGGLNTARQGPKVNYTPGVAPDVISVELGDGNKQETSKPLPTVTSKDGQVGKLVQFETVTYKPEVGGNTQQVLQDMASVSCSCSYGSSLTAYLPGQVYSSASNQLYWKAGAMQNKPTGTLDSSVNGQPTLCTSCCKEHFDGSGSGFDNFYAPLNTARVRYNSALSAVTSGKYVDACRFVRLDGFYRPLPDWNLVKVVVTTADFLAKPANQASYQKYIKYVVKTYIDWQKSTLNWTQGASATLPTITDFSAWLASNAETGGDTTTGITVSTGTAQLIARGIYVDVLDPAYLVGIDTSVTDYLTKVPFQDINLTMLAEWTMGPLTLLTGSAIDYAVVTNEAVKTVVDLNNYYFGSYSRGYMTAKKSTKDSSQILRDVVVRVTAYQGNSGITASLISPRDQSLALSADMEVKIDVEQQASPTMKVSGRIQCLERGKGNNNPPPEACGKNAFNNLSISTPNSGATCRVDKPQANNQPAAYLCEAPENSTLVINLSYTNQGSTTYMLQPPSFSVQMTPQPSNQVLSGPCSLLVDNGVTNAANLTCTP
ncbi:type IV pilus modification PilV family protein [Aeromonas salmonicida]|uniref:type IV pilus modification PilV family protein n=1 Tax=Aeromonas salmonicida TaxID=645 RepID=UPI001B5597C2|nr:prepilin-type N-terminal cleavage/methylation domain-containing protein [Aeromonas salmonicida]MBP6384321.1 prepilin-type N-terminal cleavage/methylation domain-containing protein [Aeromonas sp.]UUI60360.1 prepilin-type N-terminal cleavage/methylation domain-containing protein [Aeromonas salmonicida]HEH9412860.1 prepilin-type N-terminal cleavage/methylation domain-containing protein [Aeromonas salmonicida]HEH9421867.1 prepilin-type N-terminal cleavage/methylation domain-containing protein [A